MSSIVDYMTSKHRECDDIFSQAEADVAKKNWQAAQQKWQKFSNEIELHFQAEENILFPQFEQATGMTGGPTQVMKMEHEQIRALLTNLNLTIKNRQKADFLNNSETLMVLIQQHNMKEEMMLYPMTEQHLSDVAVVSTALREYCHN